LDIPEHGILPYLSKGLQPYTRVIPAIPMPCPQEHHEYFILKDQLSYLENRLEALSELKVIITQVKKKGTVVYENPDVKIWNTLLMLQKMLPEGLNSSMRFDSLPDRFTFTPENTNWITDARLAQLEEKLSLEIRSIPVQMENIEQDDPYKTNWKYFIEPYHGVLNWHAILLSEKAPPD